MQGKEMEDGNHSIEQDPAPVHPPPSPPRTRAPGGWKAIKYILGNESFEKLASMSLIANITVYLNTKYNMSGLLLVNVVTIWSGSSNITSLAGAVISDAYLGRFRTLLFGSTSSLLGMLLITLSAGIPKLRPSACHGESYCPQPYGWQLAFLYSGLALLCIGAGGIRPCNIAFGADQFDTTTEKGRMQLESFFNWWYFLFTITLLVALTIVVYIQTNISWVVGFAIPTACLALSITIFLLGRHTYIYKQPQASIFINMVKVVAAARRKHKFAVGENCEYPFYDPPAIGLEAQMTKLARTDRLRCLDKAAMITDPNELDDQGVPRDSWRLCSLQQVEQLKCLVGIVPVWVSGIGCFIAMDQQNTFGILQAMQIDKSVGPHFNIPPAWMGLSSMIALSIWIYIYERIYIPQARKLSKKEKRLTMQQRIMIGIVMSILCMLVAGTVEKRRRESALKHGSFVSPVSIGVLLPQFVLSGLIEAFAAVAIMEFFTTQMPGSMRTIAGAIFFLSLSIASYMSSLLVNIIHHITGKNGKSPWVGGSDLNMNRLDYYYYIIGGLAVLNFLYFGLFARNYVFKSSGSIEEQFKKSESKDAEKGLEMPEKDSITR